MVYVTLDTPRIIHVFVLFCFVSLCVCACLAHISFLVKEYKQSKHKHSLILVA